MNNKIAIIDLGYKSYEFEQKLFAGHGLILELYTNEVAEKQSKTQFAADAVGILVRATKIDRNFMEQIPNLKAIARYGIGYDNIDVVEASKLGIKVSNVQGYANHSVSDHALAMIYSLARNLNGGQKLLQANFSKPPSADIFELHNKTIGIVGLGNIGSTLATKVKGLFNRVISTDPYIDDIRFSEFGVEKVEFDTLLKESHVISVNCNYHDGSFHIFDRNAFLKMQQKPLIINTARGPIICQEALLEALNEGIIHSAGLDVFENEPPTEKEAALLNHPSVLASGHYAWYSESASIVLQQRAAENLLNMVLGNPVADCLNEKEIST